ncbi:MAG TPA: hypothetical protein VNL91_11960 [Thermoanaerobaculia bacterium]|nr:hypothetical protein [Thermoanaerobaculia bacterium]
MRSSLLVVLCSTIIAAAAVADEGRKMVPLGVVRTPAPVLLQQLQEMGAREKAAALRPVADVVLEGAEAAFIFPVVGTAGAFRTEGVLYNRRNQQQTVVAYYLPIGGGAANCDRPGRAFVMDAGSWYVYTDLVPDLFPGTSGFGSMVVVGVTANGSADPNAAIDGNARIWSGSAETGTASQNFPSFSVAVPAGPQSAFGLRADEFYRTNWGIFNYDSVARTFDIVFNGTRGSGSIATEIPPCTLVQSAVTGGPYGSLEIGFIPRDGRGLFYAYGSSVDNRSLDAWSVPARK